MVPVSAEDLITFKLPPCISSTILLESDKPKPHPVCLVLNPGRKIFFQSFFGIPLPLSSILIFIPSISFLRETLIFPLARSIASIPLRIIFSIDHAKRDPFALDLSSGLLESLYLNAEDEDGYLRDLNVFGDGISIEDDMSLIVKYASGTTMTYHLTAYSPCEGFRIAFNGTKGRIDYFVEESSYVSGSVKDKNTPSKSFKTENNSKNQIIVRPHWEESYEIKMPPEELSGHGGGDKRMLEDIFSNKNKDNFRQIADHRDGAYAFLVGLAANESFRLNLPINISRHYFENYTIKYLNETTHPISNLSLVTFGLRLH